MEMFKPQWTLHCTCSAEAMKKGEAWFTMNFEDDTLKTRWTWATTMIAAMMPEWNERVMGGWWWL